MESNKLNQLIQVNQYLSGRMEENERSVFEERLISDQDLKEELDFSAQLVQSERGKKLLEIKSWINQGIDKSINGENNFKCTSFFRWSLGIALVGLLGLSGWLFYQQKQQAALDQLIAPELLSLELVLYADDTNDENLQPGFADYSNEDYASAIDNLETYWSKSKDTNVALYIGISSLLANEPDQAIKWLIIAQGKVEPPMDEIVRWHLTLTYLKLHQIPKALQLINSWPQGGLYYDQASRFREALYRSTQFRVYASLLERA
ncbi:MAG: hypothetical protein MI974_22295 [Chitinophagales bacterium]|nr:hypothetical protein [Chitinophagales bacterium]